MIHRFRQRVLELVASGLAHTWRLEVRGEEHIGSVRPRPVIFAVWHGQLLGPLWQRRRQAITLLVSAHRDGAALGRAAGRWGYRIVEGSSTAGGGAGLRALLRALRAGGDAAMTPDGPRGPERVAKGGVIAAGRHSGAPIVPVAAAAAAAWRARSWDGFVIPKPFARVRIVYGPPVSIPSGMESEAARRMLEAALRQAEESARC